MNHSNKLPTPELGAGIPAFDPANHTPIPFVYEGPQITKTHVYLWDLNDPTLWGEASQDGFLLSHTLPSGKFELFPGRRYGIKIKVSAGDRESDYSNEAFFTCCTKPHFEFETIENRQADLKAVLKFAPNVTVRETLAAAGSHSIPPALYEPVLKQFQFYLYDQKKELIHTSELFYHTEDLSYVFRGLKNNEIYYLRASGETTDGMKLDTADNKAYGEDGYMEAVVRYQTIPANILMTLENHPEHGSVIARSNIITIGCDTKNENYTLVNGELVLWENELIYQNGFLIPRDMSIVLKARQLPLGTFFTARAADNHLCLRLHKISNQYYVKLTVANGNHQYVLYRELSRAAVSDTAGNLITTADDNRLIMIDLDYNRQCMLVITLQRKNNIYNLTLDYEEE